VSERSRGVGYTDLVYFDADAAAARGFDALPAPPCFLGTPGGSDERFSTPHGTGYRPRFGMRRSLDAGTEVTSERPLRAGRRLVLAATVPLTHALGGWDRVLAAWALPAARAC
jgi:hypothetical protein